MTTAAPFDKISVRELRVACIIGILPGNFESALTLRHAVSPVFLWTCVSARVPSSAINIL